jgi:DNA-directed RNA polymerase specialized sigma24 family protein
MNKDEVTAIIAEVLAEMTKSQTLVKEPKRTYIKHDHKVQALLQEIVETDVAYKEALRARKEAELTANLTRDRLTTLIVESRRLRISQSHLAEALGISRGAVTQRVASARKRHRKHKTTK